MTAVSLLRYRGIELSFIVSTVDKAKFIVNHIDIDTCIDVELKLKTTRDLLKSTTTTLKSNHDAKKKMRQFNVIRMFFVRSVFFSLWNYAADALQSRSFGLYFCLSSRFLFSMSRSQYILRVGRDACPSFRQQNAHSCTHFRVNGNRKSRSDDAFVVHQWRQHPLFRTESAIFDSWESFIHFASHETIAWALTFDWMQNEQRKIAQKHRRTNAKQKRIEYSQEMICNSSLNLFTKKRLHS